MQQFNAQLNPLQRQAETASQAFDKYQQGILGPQEQMLRQLFSGQITPQMVAGGMFRNAGLLGQQQGGVLGTPSGVPNSPVQIDPGMAQALRQQGGPFVQMVR
jgi:hypothetical protein